MLLVILYNCAISLLRILHHSMWCTQFNQFSQCVHSFVLFFILVFLLLLLYIYSLLHWALNILVVFFFFFFSWLSSFFIKRSFRSESFRSHHHHHFRKSILFSHTHTNVNKMMLWSIHFNWYSMHFIFIYIRMRATKICVILIRNDLMSLSSPAQFDLIKKNEQKKQHQTGNATKNCVRCGSIYFAFFFDPAHEWSQWIFQRTFFKRKINAKWLIYEISKELQSWSNRCCRSFFGIFFFLRLVAIELFWVWSACV